MPTFTQEVRNNLIDILSSRLSCLKKHDFFADYETEEIYAEDIAFECEADDYNYGCTKVVLFYNDIPDWVIKIPILGLYDGCDDVFYPFEYASPIDSDRPRNDYCAAEAWYYERAKEEGLEQFFAGTFYLDTFNNVPVYVSECINQCFWDGYIPDEHSYHLAEDILSNSEDLSSEIRFNNETLGCLIDSYGLDKIELLNIFLLIYKITDIHSGNIHIDKDGKARIVDYSGYHREEWSEND